MCPTTHYGLIEKNVVLPFPQLDSKSSLAFISSLPIPLPSIPPTIHLTFPSPSTPSPEPFSHRPHRPHSSPSLANRSTPSNDALQLVCVAD